MPCEDYREALIEAASAAADSRPPRELRSHLDACPSCRAAFTRETQLFAAIDAGVRATANAEVPASLLPRVRACFEDPSFVRPRWSPFLIFASASAIILLTVFIAARPRHATNDNQTKQILATPAREKLSTSEPVEAVGSPVVAAASRSHMQRRRNSTSPSSAASNRLEVIVPPEEREAFARFVSGQQRWSEVVIAVMEPTSENKDAPRSLEPLLIAKLKVKPLEPDSTEPDSTEEEQ
jgi:hypothetical protein